MENGDGFDILFERACDRHIHPDPVTRYTYSTHTYGVHIFHFAGGAYELYFYLPDEIYRFQYTLPSAGSGVRLNAHLHKFVR